MNSPNHYINRDMKINLIWFLPILMLLFSFLHLPYGYYTLLRIVVTCCIGYLVYLEYALNDSLSLSVILLAFLVILFNPIIPVYFSRSIWTTLDIFTILVLGIHFIVFREKTKEGDS